MSDPDRPRHNIRALVSRCIELEESRELRARTLKELARYLGELAAYCETEQLTEALHLTPEVFRTTSFSAPPAAGHRL